MMNMITAVVIVDGRCRFIKLHELSTEVVFLICSATSFVGGERQLIGLLLCHSSSHSWKLNLKLARFLTGEGDFLKQEFG